MRAGRARGGRLIRASGRGKGSRGIDFRGRELRIPPQPTEFTSRPWWPLVVRIENLGTSFSLNSLIANLRSQLGFSSDVPVNVKLKSVRVWGPLTSFTSGPLTPLSVAVLDPFSENIVNASALISVNRVLEQYTRYPDQVNRACVGYEYSLTHQSLALGSSAAVPGGDLQLLSLTGAGTGAVAYVYVLWRSGNTTPSNFSQPDDEGSSTDSEVEIVRRVPRKPTSRIM